MKPAFLKFSLSLLLVFGSLTLSTTQVRASWFNKKGSAADHAFINDYTAKITALLKDIFSIFDDYTNPNKGGSHTEYTDRAKAKVAEFKQLMDSVEAKMATTSDKKSEFYKILEKAMAIAEKRYLLLEKVCEVMESYKGSGYMMGTPLGFALKPLKDQLSSASANAQLRIELIELQKLLAAAKITNAAQLQAVIDVLAKPISPSDLLTQADTLGKRLSNS